MTKYLLFILLVWGLVGCRLMTHKEIRAEKDHLARKGQAQAQAVPLSAELNEEQAQERAQDRDRDTPAKGDTASDEAVPKKKSLATNKSLAQKLAGMEDSLRELSGRVEELNKKQADRTQEMEQGILSLIQALDLRVTALSGKKEQGTKNIKDPEQFFHKATALFEQEKWKKAIVNYQEYRKQEKNGLFYKTATFQIGRCFHKMGLKKEAMVFFREVVDSFPKSDEAKRAKGFLPSQSQ